MHSNESFELIEWILALLPASPEKSDISHKDFKRLDEVEMTQSFTSRRPLMGVASVQEISKGNWQII